MPARVTVPSMTAHESTARTAADLLRRYARPLRDALIVVGLLRAVFYYAIQGIHPWTFVGIDARAYWGVDLAHPYANSGVGEYSTYLYSPAFAQFLSPTYSLSFDAFFVLWTIASIAVLYWLVRPWPWALLILILPWTYELFVGQVHLFIAAAIVLGFRYPAVWAFNVLTKVTPGVGLLWFAVRREWRPLAISLVTTAAIAVISFALAPTAWFDWVTFLRGSTGSGELLYPRIAAAAAIVVAGAWTGRRWTVPIAVWLAMPVVWIESWVILLAIIRLREPVAPALPLRSPMRRAVTAAPQG
jgi:glycosyl transferase family 87